jgi:hypothetical protein
MIYYMEMKVQVFTLTSFSGLLNWSRRLFRLKGDFLGDQLKRSLRSAWQS